MYLQSHSISILYLTIFWLFQNVLSVCIPAAVSCCFITFCQLYDDLAIITAAQFTVSLYGATEIISVECLQEETFGYRYIYDFFFPLAGPTLASTSTSK